MHLGNLEKVKWSLSLVLSSTYSNNNFKTFLNCYLNNWILATMFMVRLQFEYKKLN